MHFEINVAKDGRHYFATAERSITDSDKAAVVVADIIKRFPESEGFTVSVSVNPQRSWRIDLSGSNSDLLSLEQLQRSMSKLANAALKGK